MSKEEIRMQVWRLMEEKGIANFPKPVFHRIPNFVGSEKAASNLRNLPEYKTAKAVFCNPESPQQPVREMALKDGKTVVMATPRLKAGFLLLNPHKIPSNRLSGASTIHGAFQHGRSVKLNEIKIDLFVVGSVAVSPDGGRLGKGTGYSDQEYNTLKNAGSLITHTPVVTTVHDIQLVENIPSDKWGVPVNLIVTPTQIIRVVMAL